MRRLALALALTFHLAGAAVPTPESHFGHRMGADRKLLDWANVVSYFQSLERNSDRIQVEELGKSTEGRPFIAATIASPETLRNLDRYKQIQARLADPRKTTDQEAAKLITEGKTVVMITCSIHATEVASTASAIEFAYKLLTEDKPKYKAILDNTIFLLVPSLNPDGVDIVTQWYRKTLGTPHEGTNPPELYQKYVGHDNNRDWYMFSQVETQLTIAKLHNVWHPQIVYDVHQQGAYSSRMFVPPWLDPIDPNIDPIIAQLCNAIGSGMAADLTSAGKTGVAINAMYDFWTPGRHYQAYHGGLRILSESASAKLATPLQVRPDELNQTAHGYSPRERSWNHLEPWRGGEWRLRDIVDYQLIAMESCLYQGAVRREDMLASFYRIGKRAVARTSPYAFVIPALQRDPGAARKMLETLAAGGVEIAQASANFEAGGKSYAAGSYVIRMQQPYSSYAKTLLERQDYPDLRMYPGGPPRRPYDVTAHTLPMLMGVAVDTVGTAFHAVTAPASRFEFAPVSTTALSGSDTESWRRLNKALDGGQPVWRDMNTGDFFVGARPSGSDARAVKRPRIGLYKSYVASMDEGWTRWLLEQFGFPYTSLYNRDFKAGNLRDRFDVIVFPDQRAEAIAHGHKPGSMPEEFTGGVGESAPEGLKQFAAKGGVVVFLNDATEYALQNLGLESRDALNGVSDREFYAPGSLLNVRVEQHPLTLGLPREMPVWFENGPAFEVTGREHAVATYPESGVLASGWLLGEKRLSRRAAIVDAPTGSGHVILFGIRPQYRAQSYQSFKLLFNALLRFE
ncbi:MAG TPA: M14 metallopeptidase family protein [Bryobacteraceae bacterium]|nr:M14 metallopeptidase family protein [Bryobacteraceae bacterium]